MHYRATFPEVSGPGKMTDDWWARFALEEAALDEGETGDMPAHDRLMRLFRGEDPRKPLVEAGNGSFPIYRTPEQGHTKACLAAAMIAAIENLRDSCGSSIGDEDEADHFFRINVQDNIPLQWADMYLESGTSQCLCDPL
jgi:hypothetical protein